MFVTHGEIGHKWQSIRGYKGPPLPETFISLHHLLCVSASTCQDAFLHVSNICSVGEYHLIIVFLLNIALLDNQKAAREVLVGVLSARHHYDLRQAIRDTWLGYIKQHPHFQNRSVPQTHTVSLLISASLELSVHTLIYCRRSDWIIDCLICGGVFCLFVCFGLQLYRKILINIPHFNIVLANVH